LHEERLGAEITGEIDRQRALLVHDIDRWVATNLPQAPVGARMHTETVGTVIDRLAQFSALAYLALTSAPEWVSVDAWHRLSELSIAYADLAAEVSAGLVRLPDLGGHGGYDYENSE
jgi:hypothetical protein